MQVIDTWSFPSVTVYCVSSGESDTDSGPSANRNDLTHKEKMLNLSSKKFLVT